MKKIHLKLLFFILIVFFGLIVVFLSLPSSKHGNDIFEGSRNNRDYFSTTTHQGKKIVDSSTGFNFLLPKDWEAQKISKSMVVMTFSSTTYSKENPQMKCRIVFQSSRLPSDKSYDLKTLKDDMQKNISENYPKAQNVRFNTIEMAGYPALQADFEFRNANSFDKFFIIDMHEKNNLFDFSGIFSNLGDKDQEMICEKGIKQIIEEATLNK